MSLSPVNAAALIQFPHTHGLAMSHGLPTMPLSPAAVVAHTVAQQRMVASDAGITKRSTSNAQKRANHNAIERARRECLNSKFQELAHSIPSLSQVRRPSKSVIVQKSLEYIYNSKQHNDARDRALRAVKNENATLREEVDRLRRTIGLSPLPERPKSKSPEPEEMYSSMEGGVDVSRTGSTDSNGGLTSASSVSSVGSIDVNLASHYLARHGSSDLDDDLDDGSGIMTLSPLSAAALHQPSTPTAAVFPHFATSAHVSAAAAVAAAAGHMPGFLDYMHTDISAAMSPVVSSFVAPLGFPTAAALSPGLHPGVDMYSSPLTLNTSAAAAMASVHAAVVGTPTTLAHPILLPSPSEDVFNMNELMMAGCIEPGHAGFVAGTLVSAEHTVEPQQIQTPPTH